MPESSAILLFMAASLALNFTPGPDMLYTAANSLSGGRRAGVAAALGITGGTFVHTCAAALGLSALLASSALAYDVVRYAGAAYLVYLGGKTLLGRHAALSLQRPAGSAEAVSRRSNWAVFRQGVTTNVLNPKVALFFLAFLPQFVDPTRGNPVLQFLLLGLLFNTSGTIVNCGVALIAGSLGEWLGERPRVARGQQWFTGGVFLALGARLALAGAR